MEAPLYPPAAAYEPPTPVAVDLRVENTSIAELMTAPKAWAIVLKHAPMLDFIVKIPVVQPNLSNFTVDSFAAFSVVSQAAVAAINAEFSKLPRSEWPAQ